MNNRNRLVSGVGTNDAEYVVATKIKDITTGKVKQWTCPYYEKWASMLKRCYSEAALKHDPTYVGCTVCDSWHLFSNFKSWMQTQDWEGKQLDKDILGDGKFYSSKTCCFVSLRVNIFLKSNYDTNKYLPGVSYVKARNKYRASIFDKEKGRLRYSGYFSAQEEAYNRWKAWKLEFAKLMIIEEKLCDRIASAVLEKVLEI